jgi:hypothetical protein
MSYVPILSPKVYPRCEPGERSVRMSPVTRGRQKMVVFTFSRDLCADLHWVRTDRLLVLFGMGESAGKIIIARSLAHRTGNVLTAHSSSAWLKLTVTIPRIVGELTREQVVAGLPTGTVRLDHEVRDGVLHITTPRLKLRVVAGGEQSEVA